jgi:putative FmdB family regulatory protein
MPIYEYTCPKCGEFEVTQRITEPPLKKCPTCRSKVKKLISNTSFQLKGSGWYVTDYARKGSGTQPADGKSDSKGGKSDSTTDSKSDSSAKDTSSTSSDSKSASKTEKSQAA